MEESNLLHLEHTGWLTFPEGDLVASYVREGWFEYLEMGFLWAYLRADDHFLDIGTHVGIHSATARKAVGKNGRVVCIEPNRELHPYIQANVQDAEIHPAVIGDADGLANFTVDSSERSSFGHLSVKSEAGFEVQSKTLASFMDGLQTLNPQLIKVDIEGAEYALFAGSPEFLRSYQGVIVIEFSKLNLERYGQSSESLEQIIRTFGYEICRFDAITCKLVPAKLEHPVWYENLYLTKDRELANTRLADVQDHVFAIVRDILAKGVAASAIHQAAEQLSKERQLVANVCGYLAGLNAHLSTSGEQPLQRVPSTHNIDQAVEELQNVYGVTKSISLHYLGEAQRRKDVLLGVIEKTGEIMHLSQRFGNDYPVDLLTTELADLNEQGLVEILSNEVQRIAQILAFVEESMDRQRITLEASTNEKDKLFAELEAISLRLELASRQISDLRKANNFASRMVAKYKRKVAEQQRTLTQHKRAIAQYRRKELKYIQELADLDTQWAGEVTDIQRSLQARNAYHAELVSVAINDLMELKKSRVLRAAGLINARVLEKIDSTIESLAT